jgi:hypothetical protein
LADSFVVISLDGCNIILSIINKKAEPYSYKVLKSKSKPSININRRRALKARNLKHYQLVNKNRSRFI